MSLIAYWIEPQYEADMKRGVDFTFNSNSKKLITVPDGETVWLFSKIKLKTTESYPLVAKLTVVGRRANPRTASWKYRVEGDRNLSAYYEPRGQGSIEDILREGGFGQTGLSLGSSFPGAGGVKVIKAATHNELSEYAEALTRLSFQRE